MQGRVKWIVALIVLLGSVTLLAGQSQPPGQFERVSAIAFASTERTQSALLAGLLRSFS